MTDQNDLPPGEAASEDLTTSQEPSNEGVAETENNGAAGLQTDESSEAGDLTDEGRAERKLRLGMVVSNKMQKTVVVRVERSVRHPLYGRTVKTARTFKAHDEHNECGVGDRVEIRETRPLSKEKRWRVSRIVEKAR